MCGEKQDRLEPVFVQNSGHVDDDIHIFALDVFCEMDGRTSRYIREVLDWNRGEDAGDLQRSELNELVENVTCLNAFEEKFWKSNQKIAMKTFGCSQKIKIFTLRVSVSADSLQVHDSAFFV